MRGGRPTHPSSVSARRSKQPDPVVLPRLRLGRHPLRLEAQDLLGPGRDLRGIALGDQPDGVVSPRLVLGLGALLGQPQLWKRQASASAASRSPRSRRPCSAQASASSALRSVSRFF